MRVCVAARRFLYLADRDELCARQDKFERLFGIDVALDKAESKAGTRAGVVIASIQTLSRDHRLRRYGPDHFRHLRR
jgi:superfamily II DNA or RNA helicase